MAATPSTMQSLGTSMPTFSLPEPATGRTIRSEEFSGAPVVVAFFCNHCPFVKLIADKFADVARECEELGARVVAINSNDVENYPEDSPDKMIEEEKLRGYTFPYLYDESQSVAKEFKAACTPDFFVYDSAGKLAYRGQFDDARPGSDEAVTGADLKEAVAAICAGKPAPEVQKPSIGCNIKWKPGAEPGY